jgi:hypothetical protein
MSLIWLKRHIRDHGAGKPPARGGQPTRTPPTLGPALEGTIALNQDQAGTGGDSKQAVMQMMRKAIKGSAYEEQFDTEEKFETAYRTWLTTAGGKMSRSGVKSRDETDIVRLHWMRATKVILWQMGTARELIKMGFMTANVQPLPEGHPGGRPEFAEFGLNYNQGSWVPGATDFVYFSDEVDVTPEYTAQKGGQNVLVHASSISRPQEDGTVKVQPVKRLTASLKPVKKISCMGSLTASGKPLPQLYMYQATAADAPNVFIPECQVCAPCTVDREFQMPCGVLCECQWYDKDQQPVKRADLRTMAFALALKTHPDISDQLLGRSVTRRDVGGVIDGLPVAGTATLTSLVGNVPTWLVRWSDGNTNQYPWASLVGMLDDPYAMDRSGHQIALELAQVIGRSIKPGWVRGLPTTEVDMDGREKLFHSRVCYNESGGRNTLSWQRAKTVAWTEAHDELSVLKPDVSITDGATGLRNAANLVADLIAGRVPKATHPNGSSGCQPSDDSNLHGQAKRREEAEKAQILFERRVGTVGEAAGEGASAKLLMTDFPRLMRARDTVMGDPRCTKKALESTGFAPFSIAATLDCDKVINDLKEQNGGEALSLTGHLYNTHAKALMAAHGDGLDMRTFRVSSMQAEHSVRDLSAISAQELYEEMQGARESTGTFAGKGFWGRNLSNSIALFAQLDAHTKKVTKAQAAQAKDIHRARARRQEADEIRTELMLPVLRLLHANMPVQADDDDDDDDRVTVYEILSDPHREFVRGERVQCPGCDQWLQCDDSEVGILCCPTCRDQVTPGTPTLTFDTLSLEKCIKLYKDYGYTTLLEGEGTLAVNKCKKGQRPQMRQRLKIAMVDEEEEPPELELETSDANTDVVKATMASLRPYVGLETMHTLQVVGGYAAFRMELARRTITGDGNNAVHTQELAAVGTKISEALADLAKLEGVLDSHPQLSQPVNQVLQQGAVVTWPDRSLD